MHRKESLENKIHVPQKGVESEEGLRHEYDCPASCGGCIQTFYFVGSGGRDGG